MRLLLDPPGLWIGRPGRQLRLLQGNRAPVAIDDALTVLQDSGPVTVQVLTNDIDPEGGTLSLVSAYAALGTAVAEADDTVTYTPPPGVFGPDTIVYEIADDQNARNTGQVNVTITEPVLSVDQTPSNSLTVTSESGPIDITLSAPAVFAGTYQRDTAALTGGPVNLVAPDVSGTPDEGAVLDAVPGLWIHATEDAPVTRSWQWRRAGGAIAGATGGSYTVTAFDVGQGLSVTETLSDGAGQRSAQSATLGALPAPDSDAALLGWWDAADAATISATGGKVQSWADKAGGAPLTQGNASFEPLTGTRSLNGRNMLHFGGSPFLTRAQSVPVSGDIAFHMALILDPPTSAFEAVLALEATNDFQLDAASDTQFTGRLNVTGVGDDLSLTGGPFTGPLILSVVFDFSGAGQAEVFVNDVSRGVMTYTAALDASAALHVMSNRSLNADGHGALGDLIVTADVSGAARAQHHAYLAAKWGIS